MLISGIPTKLAATLRIVLGVLVLLGAGRTAANTLEDIDFSSLPGDRFEVRMEFSDAAPDPSGYTIEEPARIVLDFPEVASGLADNRYPLSLVNARSAMVLEGGGRTRLILNLDDLTPYRSRSDGDNVYVVEVGSEESPGTPQGQQAADSEESGGPMSTAIVQDADEEQSTPGETDGSSTRITNIDFHRGDEDEGRVVISLSNPQVDIDMQEAGGTIDLNFQDTELPDNLANRYDVVDFATPVRYVDAASDEAGANISVEASGQYDYLAYQAEDEYIISVKPLTEREIEEREDRFDYTGERISLNFQDIPVRSVLQIIADMTDLNLVTGDSVTGNIALRLDDVPWDQALDLVLRTKGLDQRQEGNVLMVAPADEIAERERQELENAQQLEELAPLRTEYFRIRYASADQLFSLFRSEGGGGENGSMLSERGHAVVDDRTNSIILTDTEEKLSRFRRLVDQLDIPIRQVMIEARIVIANADLQRDTGIRWGLMGAEMRDGDLIEASGSREGLDSDPGAPGDFFFGSGETDMQENTVVDLGVPGAAGSVAFDILSDNVLLDLELSALEDSGEAEVVSQPKVITGDKQQATIESGEQIPYQEASASGATTTAFQDAVLSLDVTPQITPDNNIIMDLAISQDSISDFVISSGGGGEEGGGGGSVPAIDITQIETQVLVGDGETVVLGGIYQTDQQSSVVKVPFLGDLPYLGRLFRQTLHRQNKRELLIFITPKILADTLVR